ncbi:MAG: DegV family protein [Gracilibacteraceae bacterium]|jgi:DegV family protein with EDD domain|nr:DegV family protein [Gracilibacteraceae bacterium]
MSKVIITADSPCDIGPELIKKYNVEIMNWRIMLEDKEYIDGVEIFPDDLYKAWWERKALPKSSACVPAEYEAFFTPLLKGDCEIVHIGLGSGLSGSYQHACTTAEKLGRIYPVDSKNLSAGFGLLVVQAAELAMKGLTAPEIQTHLQNMTHHVQASFLIDTLEFMRAGGRCSTMAMLGANLFNIKPCIEVENDNGGLMHVGEKYRGKMERCLRLYVHDKLEGRKDIDLKRVFITHSGSPESDIEMVKEEITALQDFQECYVTRAGCVISTHCGPRTLGVLFVTKPES